MEPFKLEKADFSSIDTKTIFDVYLKNQEVFSDYLRQISEEDYYYWDKVKYIPSPPGITPVIAWFVAKFIRNLSARKTIIKAENGKNFEWVRMNKTDEYLHKIDMTIGGEIFSHYQNIITPYGKRRLLTKSIIEESIASSQLEGAVTTTAMAKKIILENKTPRDRSERMIVNNYKTMQAITTEYKNQSLSEGMLFELHKLIAKDTLDEDKQGRYRLDSDDITVNDQQRYIYHVPPKEVFLRDQMSSLIKYANDEDEKHFMHPIVKAIFIHFWIGYLHPFYDGNGRIARTLFYWYLLRKGYWAIPYLPISLVIKNSATQYGMAFVYSEQDDLDLTYFYDFHMKKVLEALNNFESYVKRKGKENTEIQDILEQKYHLNDRQQELIRYLIAKGDGGYITPSSYTTLYKVSRETTNKDLKQLESINLLEKRRVGKNMRYFGSNLLKKEFVT